MLLGACSLAKLIFCKYKVNSEGRLSPVEVFTAVVTKRNKPNHIILNCSYSLPQRSSWQILAHFLDLCQLVDNDFVYKLNGREIVRSF